jgi:hypothetical protein
MSPKGFLGMSFSFTGLLRPGMEVKKIILEKVLRHCQLSSSGRGFLSRLSIFLNPCGLAYGFLLGRGREAGVCTFFTFFHILLVALFFVNFLIY